MMPHCFSSGIWEKEEQSNVAQVPCEPANGVLKIKLGRITGILPYRAAEGVVGGAVEKTAEKGIKVKKNVNPRDQSDTKCYDYQFDHAVGFGVAK